MVAPLGSRQSSIEPGDRFQQVFPPSGDTLEVESWIDDDRVAVRRRSGARQSFPVSTLLNPAWWLRAERQSRVVCSHCDEPILVPGTGVGRNGKLFHAEREECRRAAVAVLTARQRAEARWDR